MPVVLDSILSTIPSCVWARSPQYFPYGDQLGQIGFTGLFDTDVFVETSFAVQGEVPLVGATIQTFTKDNEENQDFIVYALPVNNILAYDVVTIDLIKQQVFSRANIRKLLLTFPWVSFVVFNVLLLLLPQAVGSFFYTLNLLALLVTFVVFAVKVLRFVLRFVRSQRFSVGSKQITYVDSEDQYALHAYHLHALQLLVPFGVSRAVVYDGKLYLRQEVPEVELASVQGALQTMLSPEFYHVFIADESA